MKRAITLGLVLLALSTGNAFAATCDTPCLRSQIDRYLTALTAGDPSKLTLAANVRR